MTSNDQKHSVLCILGLKETKRYWWHKLHNIVNRCYSHACPRFKDYGGRGIAISPDWYDTKNHTYDAIAFAEYCIAHGWKPGLQIDRIDNDGNYEPGNIRFVTAHDNSRNRRDTIRYLVDGTEMCAKDACASVGLEYKTYCARIAGGWDRTRALTIPKGKRRPFLCFNRGVRGGCELMGRHACPFSTDEEMRSCDRFAEFKIGMAIRAL